MQNLRIVIVEDEMVIAMDIQEMLQEVGYTVCGIATSYEEALSVMKTAHPDLFLLDIGIRGTKNGIGLAHTLQQLGLPFIFTTSRTESSYIESAKSTKPYGYLLKPFNKLDLYTSIEMAIGHLQSNKVQSLYLPMGRNKHHVALNDLFLIKANGNYVELKIGERRVALRKNLKEFEAKLPTGHPFIRVHKSYLVNRNHISSFNQLEINLLDGTKVPIGRTYFTEIKSNMMIV
ncbi:MAG TPA: LytTR family transcriptional regulator DNA-binding domain-containing protein [Pseudosphingobacterium sp.]|nr:LytTR family transcriptional regulator DNA-binding domain-containing protein [Pseudosphingobacterium sp.]